MPDIKSSDPDFEDLEDYEGACPKCGEAMHLISDIDDMSGLQCFNKKCGYTVFADPGADRSIFDD